MAKKKINLKLKTKDYDEALLPSTRRSQFKDILSHEYKSLLLVGMWLLIFFVPILFMESFANIFVYTYVQQNNSSLTPEQTKSFEMLVTIIKESSMVIGYMIFSIAIAGSLRIIRNLVYGEPLFFKDDFILGVKKYWKVCLVLSFIFALLKGGTNILLYLANNFSTSDLPYILSGFSFGVLYLLVVPTILFFISLYITYQIKIIQTFSLAIKFVLSNLLISVAFSLPIFGTTFLWYIGILLVVDIILIVLVFLVGPLYILLWHLYVTSRFDKFINKKQFPEIYRKGLQKGE